MKIKQFGDFFLNEAAGTKKTYLLIRFGTRPDPRVTAVIRGISNEAKAAPGPGMIISEFKSTETKENIEAMLSPLNIRYFLLDLAEASGTPLGGKPAQSPENINLMNTVGSIRPGSTTQRPTLTPAAKIAKLKAELTKAIKEEDYETAAIKRNEIEALGGSVTETEEAFFAGYTIDLEEDAKFYQHSGKGEKNDDEYKVGSKWTHKKHGPGVIIKDPEGQCKKDEVLFKPEDNSNLGINPETGGESALHSGPAKWDIVKKSDLKK